MTRRLLLFVIAFGFLAGCVLHATGNRGISAADRWQSRPVEGIVRDKFTHAPIAGATVTLNAGGKQLSKKTTGGEGTFVLEGTGQHRYLEVVAAGYSPHRSSVSYIPRREKIDLRVGSTISGVVRDSLTRKPVAGAKVSCLRGMTLLTDTVTTDETGTYRLEHCLRSIATRADGYAWDTTMFGSVVDGDELRGDSWLSPPVPVKGRVIDERGQPVAGAYVLAFIASINPFLGATGWTMTAADGTFSMPLAAGSELEIVAFGERGPVVVEELALREPVDLEMTIPDGVLLKGRVVTPRGDPAPDTRVLATWYLLDGTARQLDSIRGYYLRDLGWDWDVGKAIGFTDDDGRLAFDGMWAHNVNVRVRHDDLGFTNASASLTSDLLMVLSTGGTLAGVLVDTAGNPVDADGDLSLFYSGIDGRGFGTRSGHIEPHAISRGRFQMSGLTEGYWNVDLGYDNDTVYMENKLVEIKKDQTTTVRWMVLRNSSVYGRIVDPSGRPVSNTCVSAEYHAPPGPGTLFGQKNAKRCVQTDRLGRFRHDGVRGKVTLSLERGTKERSWPYSPKEHVLDVPAGGLEVDAGTIALEYAPRTP